MITKIKIEELPPEVTQNKAYIVVDIPEPVHEQIKQMRTVLASKSAMLPAEITLAGSSGVDPIPPGVEIELIKREVSRIAAQFHPFEVSFDCIEYFPGTGIFYLRPTDRKPFDLIHSALCSSKIQFPPSAFPYNPHLTIRNDAPVDEQTTETIQAMPFPRDSFVIDALSVYELNEDEYEATLIYRAKLIN